jgi:hypothetical protein
MCGGWWRKAHHVFEKSWSIPFKSADVRGTSHRDALDLGDTRAGVCPILRELARS